MLNSKSLRDLNKLKIYKSTDQSIGSPFFTAYTSQGWSTDLSLNISNLWGSGSSMGGGDGLNFSNLLKFVVAEYGKDFNLPSSWAFDFSSKKVFNGGTPSSFNINCFLLLETDYMTDILNPLKELVKFFLPSRGVAVNNSELINSLNSTFENKKSKEIKNQSLKGNTSSTGGIWDIAQKAVNWLNTQVGQVYTLNPPEMLDPNKNVKTSFQLSSILVEDVLLKGVHIETPQCFIKDSQYGPIPDRMNLSLSFVTTRCMTVESLDHFLNPTISLLK